MDGFSMYQSWETMTSVSAGHIILTPTQPVGSGRPQRESNPGPPQQESCALPTELPRPPYQKDGRSNRFCQSLGQIIFKKKTTWKLEKPRFIFLDTVFINLGTVQSSVKKLMKKNPILNLVYKCFEWIDERK